MGQEYSTRTDMVTASRAAFASSQGKGMRLDASRSGQKRFILRCSSVIKTTTTTSADGSKIRGKTEWVVASKAGAQDSGFECARKDGETDRVFAIRRNAALEVWGEAEGFCCAKVLGIVDKEGKWKLAELKDGENFRLHNDECTAVATVNGKTLVHMMKSHISSAGMSGKEVKAAVTGAGSSLGANMMPSTSAIYRAQVRVFWGHCSGGTPVPPSPPPPSPPTLAQTCLSSSVSSQCGWGDALELLLLMTSLARV